MAKRNWDLDWKFQLADGAMGFISDWRDMRCARTVHLPHDFQWELGRAPISPSSSWGGFYRGGIGVYLKNLGPRAQYAGKRVILEVEGAYQLAEVRVGRDLATLNQNGYTSFLCDLTDFLGDGENPLSITVNASCLPNTRWYSGAGLYRSVHLWVQDPVSIAPWGVSGHTDRLGDGQATVGVSYQLTSALSEEIACELLTELVDDGGRIVARAQDRVNLRGGETTALESSPLTVAGTRLWSPDTPCLYTIRTRLRAGDSQDFRETPLGIRQISLSAEEGFLLNGRREILRGACVHHDCGLLGAASFYDAEARKVRLLKESGFNAVRCAHNPPSPNFLDACDKLGMLVIDEAFDAWLDGKAANDYHLHFIQCWQADLAAMVLRDRRHPSVVFWSTGNEIAERDGRSYGYAWAQALADEVRRLDPTRPVTHALCDLWHPDGKGHFFEATAPFVKMLDAVGYNYLLKRYREDHAKLPDRVLIGTETFPLEAYENHRAALDNRYVLGDFVWTGIDYLGEAGIGNVSHDGVRRSLGEYPWHQAWCGDIDLCGDKRAQSHYRDAVYAIDKAPYIAAHHPENFGKPTVLSPWAWPDTADFWDFPGWEERETIVEIYSSLEEIELFQDGASLGRAPLERCACRFALRYRPGELVAVGYRGGVEVARSARRTPGPAVKLAVLPELSTLSSQYGALCYARVALLDEAGDVAAHESREIELSAQGVGTLAALGCAKPDSPEEFSQHRRHAHHGTLTAVLCASGTPGTIVLRASCGAMTASAEIDVR